MNFFYYHSFFFLFLPKIDLRKLIEYFHSDKQYQILFVLFRYKFFIIFINFYTQIKRDESDSQSLIKVLCHQKPLQIFVIANKLINYRNVINQVMLYTVFEGF